MPPTKKRAAPRRASDQQTGDSAISGRAASYPMGDEQHTRKPM
jgi:hypothetical protein